MMSSEKWRKELDFLRAIISKTPLEKAKKWGNEVYTINNGNVLMIGAFKHYISLWFFNGVFLTDPYQVLTNAQEGKTKALRHWKFASVAEMEEEKIMEYLKESIENEMKGLRWKPDKSDELTVTNFLKEEFETDKAFERAFEELTPFKQKEYFEFIDTAKRETTKINRLQKIKPLVLEGVGLNDKYRK